MPALPMNLSEITETLTDIARNGEGADRIRALKMLQAMHSTGVSIPVPQSEAEVIRDLAVLMRCAGARARQLALARATGTDRAPLTVAYDIDNAPPELIEKARRVTTTKRFFKAFPHLKGPGTPRGYPRPRGPIKGTDLEELRAKFYQRLALKQYIAEERTRVETAMRDHDKFVAENPRPEVPERAEDPD